ncbi:MAG: hypothetical protein V4471_03840 [Pseudomonadota bacterium]
MEDSDKKLAKLDEKVNAMHNRLEDIESKFVQFNTQLQKASERKVKWEPIKLEANIIDVPSPFI